METLARDRMGSVEIRMRHTLEVRYTGQDFSLPVSVDPACYSGDYAAIVRDAFHQLHQARFGYHDAHLALEIVNAHLAAVAPRTLDALPAPSRDGGQAWLGKRPVVFDADAVDCPVYRRESLASGERIHGPAIIQEYASTTALFPQDYAEVTASGELLVHVGGDA
jgi:N-methylhydantoinase A